MMCSNMRYEVEPFDVLTLHVYTPSMNLKYNYNEQIIIDYYYYLKTFQLQDIDTISTTL
jgi:hypothetical protein